jgi:hypothetical protein
MQLKVYLGLSENDLRLSSLHDLGCQLYNYRLQYSVLKVHFSISPDHPVPKTTTARPNSSHNFLTLSVTVAGAIIIFPPQ